MITSFYLIVEAESLETRINGPALGNIRLVINDCEFPTANWNDFVVIVLGWWGASLLSLLNNDSTRETVRFMDGQYAVELQNRGVKNIILLGIAFFSKELKLIQEEVE